MNYCVGRQIEMTHLTFEKEEKIIKNIEQKCGGKTAENCQ